MDPAAGIGRLCGGSAWWGDRRPLYPERPWLRPAVYSLALAVYCSSWTFYGAVGSAVRNGAGYLPIYLGPLLMLLFGWRIVERLALIARSENTVSIADFISSRYGRSRRLAALVAVIALVGVVPYLALQYKAVAMSLQVLSGQSSAGAPFYADPALYVALGMALFATLFGTRQVDATEHHHGMMLAIALESCDWCRSPRPAWRCSAAATWPTTASCWRCHWPTAAARWRWSPTSAVFPPPPAWSSSPASRWRR
ncbi:hypothetical protein NB693_20430 [Pantoea ananatis]|uniref:sodium:solute symporter family transporter n=1 Tax=Pantoea ananas TaxID=553 RepID=UPI00221ECCF0|nr:hypothetical protein [Pantoea ananatis]